MKNILVFTGNGKGKSTASFGMVLRAVGHGQRVLIVQFMKNDDTTGEYGVLRDRLGVEMLQTGLGFVPKDDHPRYPDHREAALKGFAISRKALLSGEYDLIVLDEVCGAIGRGLLDETEVLEALQQAPEPVNIVLTGRGATDRLIALADTVTEMRPLKHALEQGIAARKGVEF